MKAAPHSFLGIHAEAWRGKRVLLIQDNGSNLDDPTHPINQLRQLEVEIYLLVRPTTWKLSTLQKHPAVTGVVTYEGGRHNLWHLFMFARSHPFDVAILYCPKEQYLDRYFGLTVSFLFWKAQKKIALIEDHTGLLQNVSIPRFLWKSKNKILPIITAIVFRPCISLRNRLYGKRVINPDRVKRILLIRLDHIGDVVMASSLIDPLREHFPNATIDLLIGPWSEALFATDSRIRKILTFAAPWHERRTQAERSRDNPAMPRHLSGLIHTLRKERYTIAIDSRGNFFDSIIAQQSGATIPAGTVGSFYNNGIIDNTFLLTYPVAYGSEAHPAVEQHARLARALGCLVGAELTPRLQWGHDEEVAVQEMLDTIKTRGIRIAVHMHSGDTARVWPKEKYSETLQKLSVMYGDRICFFLLGSPDEKEKNESVMNDLPETVQVYNFAGKLSLKQLPAFLADMDLFIGNDSGPVHIAGAVGTPVVALFIRDLSHIHAPRGENAIIITTSEDETKNMATITVDAVVHAVEGLIRNMAQS
jgi:heptosyltransferase-3